MANHSALKAFESYVLSGRFNRDASQAVAEAIAESRALGLPVEGCLNGDPAPAAASVIGSSRKSSAASRAPKLKRHAAA
jgi:hypothetical protein